jgi:hypothetical protein
VSHSWGLRHGTRQRCATGSTTRFALYQPTLMMMEVIWLLLHHALMD